MMKQRRYGALLLAVCLAAALFCCGCEKKSGNTIEEPDITAEYLEEEYSQQLLTDGAETMTGTISLKESNDSYQIHIAEKEVVPSSRYKEGYYIADTNAEKDATVGANVRIAGNTDGEATVLTTEELEQAISKDAEQLYTVYLMGDSAELILSTDASELLDTSGTN